MPIVDTNAPLATNSDAASCAYNKAALRLFGEYALLNEVR